MLLWCLAPGCVVSGTTPVPDTPSPLVSGTPSIVRPAPIRPVHPLHRFLLKASNDLSPRLRAMLIADLAHRACAAGKIDEGLALTPQRPKSSCLTSYVMARARAASSGVDVSMLSLNIRVRLTHLLSDDASLDSDARWALVVSEVEAIEDLDERLELGLFVLDHAPYNERLDRAWVGRLVTWIERVQYPSLRTNWYFKLADALYTSRGAQELALIPSGRLPGKKRVKSHVDQRVMVYYTRAHKEWEKAWVWMHEYDDQYDGPNPPLFFEQLIRELLGTGIDASLMTWAARHTPESTPLFLYTDVATRALALKDTAMAERAISMATTAFADERARKSARWTHHTAQLLNARGKRAQAVKQWESLVKRIRRDNLENRVELDDMLRVGPEIISHVWTQGHSALALSLLDVMLHVADARGRPFELTSLPTQMDEQVWTRAIHYKRAKSFVDSITGVRTEPLHKRILSDLHHLKFSDAISISHSVVQRCSTPACKARGLGVLTQQLHLVQHAPTVLSTLNLSSWSMPLPELVEWVRQQPSELRSALWLKLLQQFPSSALPPEMLLMVFQDASANKQRVGARRSMRSIVSHFIQQDRCDLAWSVQRAQVDPLSLGKQDMRKCTNPSHLQSKVLLTSYLDVSLAQKMSYYAEHMGHLPELDWATLLPQLNALEKSKAAQSKSATF